MLNSEQIQLFIDDWIETIHAARTNSEQHEKFHEFIDFVEDCFEYRSFDTIDEVLGKLNQSLITTFLITGILRVTYRGRKMLKNWSAFRDRAIDTLKARNEDDRVLVGLLGD